jgi:hypothetical protein
MSGMGRDTSTSAGGSGTTPLGDEPGSASVHAGIAFNPTAESESGERVVNRVKEATESLGERAGELGQRARGVAGDVVERAGGLASRARGRMEELSDRAQSALEERGWLERLKENPLPALGVAFAAGFLLAGGTRGGASAPASRAQRVRGELRGALATGLSAGLAQGARAFLRSAGAEDGVINAVMQSFPGLGGGEEESGAERAGPRGAGRPATRGNRGPSASGGRTTGGRPRETSHRDDY